MTRLRPKFKRAEQGFTLVEMLIALFLFSLISVGSMAALTTALRGKAQIETRMEAQGAMDTARALILADMDQLILYPGRDPLGNAAQYLLVGGADSLITFTRAGRANPGSLEARGELQRVGYYYEGDRIIRRALSSANPAPDAAVIERVLYKGVQSAQTEFVFTEGNAANTALDGTLITLDQLAILNPPQESQTLVLRYVTLSLTFDDGQSLVQHFEVNL